MNAEREYVNKFLNDDLLHTNLWICFNNANKRCSIQLNWTERLNWTEHPFNEGDTCKRLHTTETSVVEMKRILGKLLI